MVQTYFNIVQFPAVVGLCACMLLAGGCSGKVKYGAANIGSTPAGAEIINLRDDTNLGMTPAHVVWEGKDSEQVTIQLRKSGYRSTITSFWINKRHSSEDEALANAIDVHSELEQE